MAHFFGQKDPVSRLLMEEILAKEEERADELADLLFAVEPESGEVSSRLYFKDEIPGESDAGQPVNTAATGEDSAKKHRRRGRSIVLICKNQRIEGTSERPTEPKRTTNDD